MIISTCGFGSSGSSAVTDYLREYGDFQVFDKVELTFVYLPDGLIDLEYHLNHPHGRIFDSIVAIDRYKEKMDEVARVYQNNAGYDAKAIKLSTEKFIKSITMLNWYWYYKDSPKNPFERLFVSKIINGRIIPYIEKKKGRQINCYPMKEVAFSVQPENFYEAAKTHVREILDIIGVDRSKNTIFDQAFSGHNPQPCFSFYDDPYAIVVDRDPRDMYVFSKTKLVGRNHFMAVDTVENFCTYYRALRDNQPYKETNDRILCLQFEDMVYHYEEATKKIRSFLNLPENPNPKSIFNPQISMPNTQVWKRFPEFSEDIKYIEKQLKEYLFDYSGLPEPDPNQKMFFGKSPLNKN